MTTGTEPDARRFVWAGRHQVPFPAHDGWAVPRVPLELLLADVCELVVLDVLSFPWEELREQHWDLPTVLVVPDATVTGVIERAVGKEVLRRLRTPSDRVFSRLDDALAHLSEHAPDPDGPRRKVGYVAAGAILEVELREVELSFGARGLRVDVDGAQSRKLLSYVGRPRITIQEGGPSSVEVAMVEDRRPPHAVVVTFDEDDEASMRTKILANARDALRPGGALIVVEDVVATATRPDARSISALLDEVQSATGMTMALEELRSVRWPGEALSRTVLLRYSALVMDHDMRGPE